MTIDFFKFGYFDVAAATTFRKALTAMLAGQGARLGRIFDSSECAAARLMSVVCNIAEFHVACMYRYAVNLVRVITDHEH